MKPEEHIELAQVLCSNIRSASTKIGPQNRQSLVKGADPNELKKILSFMLAKRELLKESGNLELVRNLVEKLRTSNFSKRSGSTPAYYKNIQDAAIRTGFYSLGLDDALQVLGWACRLL